MAHVPSVLVTPEGSNAPTVIHVPAPPPAFATALKGAEQDETVIFKAGRARRKLYRSLTVLGRGADGEVRLVECLDNASERVLPKEATANKRRAAMKVIPKTNADTPIGQLKIRGVRIMAPLLGAACKANQHLPTYVDAFEDETRIYVVWELLACPLTAFVARRGGKLSEDEVAKVLAGLVSAISTLHAVDIVHRDLKPANLMLRDAQDLSSVCVCDFANALVRELALKMFRALGASSPNSAASNNTTAMASQPNSTMGDSISAASATSTSFSTALSGNSSGDGSIPGSSTSNNVPSVMSLVAGTPLYMSPQASKALPPSQKDDIWSIGCIAYELLYGKGPFEGSHNMVELMNRILEGKINPPPANIQVSDGAKAFVARLLNLDDTARPTAEELLNDPWLAPALNADILHMTRKRVGQAPHNVPEEGTLPAVAVGSSQDCEQSISATEQAAPRLAKESQNLLPPLTLFSQTFVGDKNHAFTVTGAQVVFDPETGELRVVGLGGANSSVQAWAQSANWDDEDSDDPLMSL